jgi:hypothetical protein
MNSDTLDLRWIQEEEKLLHMIDIPQPTLLETVRICVLFIDTDLAIVHRQSYHSPLTLDISNNVSVLLKTELIAHIERAKREMPRYMGASFSVMDVLIWNENMNTDYIHKCAESDPEFTEWCMSSRFVHGSIFEDMVLNPSIFPFHSNQTVYVLLRETHKPKHSSSNKTKRVHFSPTISIAKNTRRKV